MSEEDFGHAEHLNRSKADESGHTCGSPHPILEDVVCHRLNGHPGNHGSAVDSDSVEVMMEWPERS